MTTGPVPQCAYCRHLHGFLGPGGKTASQSCDAFPTHIPDVIWTNQFDHRKPYQGDHGIHWESRDGLEYPEKALGLAQEIMKEK
jgi:hypothetical protein